MANKICVRLMTPEDLAAYRDLYLQLDVETPYRLYEPGERPNTLAEFAPEVERFTNGQNGAVLLAQDEESGQLVGYLQAIRRPQRRIRHVVSINVALLQAYTGQGLGARMFSFLEDWARQQGVQRLDLSVMENNKNAYKLYCRLGFKDEGIKRRSMRFGDTYVDEITMAKWLKET